MVRLLRYNLQNLLLGAVFLAIVSLLLVLLHFEITSASIIDIVISSLLTASLIILYSIQTNIQSKQSKLVEQQTDIMGEQWRMQEKQAEIMDKQQQTQSSQTQIMSSQKDIGEQQTDILQNQSNLMKLEYEPELVVKDCSFSESNINLVLANIGRGIAKHLYIHTEIFAGSLPQERRTHDPSTIPDNAWHHSEDALFFRTKEGTEYVNGISSLKREKSHESLTKRVEGGSLGADQEGSFVGTPRIYRYPAGMGATGVEINETIDDLREENVKSAHIIFDLVYCNENISPTSNDIRIKQIDARSFKLDEFNTLDGFLSLPGSTSGNRQKIIEQLSEYPKYPPTSR